MKGRSYSYPAIMMKELCVLSALLLACTVPSAKASRAQVAPEAADSTMETLYAMKQHGEAAWPALQRPISINLDRVSLVRALRAIAQEANFGLAYSTDVVPEDRLVSVQIERGSVAEALQAVLDNTDLRVVITPRNEIVLVKAPPMEEIPVVPVRPARLALPLGRLAEVMPRPRGGRQQTGTIAGTVTDSTTGEALPGVNVVIAGTQQGAATDADGAFTISDLEPGTYGLLASFVGYASKRIAGIDVTVEDTTTVNIALSRTELGLEEVIVVGYGTQERQDLTGAISSISGEDIGKLPTTGIQQALQAKAPGVFVKPNSGAPGASFSVRIRGVTTIGSTSPLYVIDGVPVVNEGGSPNPLSLLNPNSIESIQVLKDASATAIYGARAANGVVLIETKRGQTGEIQVTADLSAGVQRFADYIPMLNSREYAQLAIEALHAAGRPTPEAFQDPEVLEQNTNWQAEAFSAAPVQDYAMTVSGGNEFARFAVMGGYFNQQGVLPGSGYKRNNIRINTDFDISDKFRIGESVMLARAKWQGGHTGGVNLIELLQASPTMPVYNPNNEGGFSGPTPAVTGPNNEPNHILTMTLVQNDEIQNRILGNVYGEYEFIEGLTYRLSLGGDFLFTSHKTFTPTYESGSRTNPIAGLSRSEQNSRTYLVENTLSYERVFGNVHDLSMVIGYTQQESFFETLAGSKEEFPSNDLRTISAGLGGSSLEGYQSEWAMRSFLARVNYIYDSKYLVTATLRRDGSSRFGENNRWGNFPSFSLGWRLSEEPFMQNISWLTSLKIRGGWGRVGNQAGIGNYASYSTIEPVVDYILGGDQHVAPGAAYLTLGNSNVRWESTEQLNIGLDAALFDGQLSVTANYYRKITEGLLLRPPINTASGIFRFSGPVVNAASLKNTGVELAATYSSQLGAFQYDLSANITTVNNEVLSLGGGGNSIVTQVCADDGICALTYTEVGGEVGAHYGYVMEGIFDSQDEIAQHAEQPAAAPGDVKFKDLNGDGVIDAEDRTIIGSPIPGFFYGFSASFYYKRFDFSFFVEGVQGREIYNLQQAGIMDLRGDNNLASAVLDRWTPQNKDTNIPRAIYTDPNNNMRTSTRFLEDGSFLRLSSVTLGYQFGLSDAGVSSLRVYVGAQNVFTITDYRGWNPDFGASSGDATLAAGIDRSTYPVPRQYNVGVQITF